ncbi:MAG: hypothetical protein IKC11_05950 [Clostridia bacterium]|nr:hypothetical protein [Clostridia bacterium]
MIDENLIQRIISAEASKEEVFECAKAIMKETCRERFTFETYYKKEDFDVILEKYKSKEIDAEYISYWSHIYTNLIMSSVWKESADRDLYPIEVIMYKISDYLDEMYFADSYDIYAFEKVIKSVGVADKVYKALKNKNKVRVVCNVSPAVLEIVYVLEEQKEFAPFEMLVEEDQVYDAEQVELEEYNSLLSKLKEEGYKNLFEAF